MAIQLRPRQTYVFVGDSLTADGWFDQAQSNKGGTGLLVQQLTGMCRSTYVTGTSVSSGGFAPIVNAINSGAGGNQIADVEAAIAARITNYNPDVVVMMIGINDCRGVPIGPTALATFRASYDNILATTIATLPSVKIVCVGIMAINELWSSTAPNPHFSGNAFDTGALSIDNYNAQMQASALAHASLYIDPRTPAALAESASNTPEPGAINGILTGDGIHPTAAGQRLISTAVKAAFVFP